VVLPGDHRQVRAVLSLCGRDSLAVVPFGGGTSVVGALLPCACEHAAVVALDMGRMGEVLELDSESRTVRYRRARELRRSSAI